MSLKDHAMIVSVVVENPPKTRTDRKAITETAKKFNVDPEALNLSKDLYPKHLIEPIEQVERRARAHAKNGNYVWDRNKFLLVMTRFMEFADKATEIELEHSQAVTVFLNNFSNVLMEAQNNLGDLYDPDLYPSLDTLKRQFVLKFKYSLLTEDPNDIRQNLPPSVRDEIVAATSADIMESMAGLRRAPLEQLRDHLCHLTDKLSEPPTEKRDRDGNLIELRPSIFRNSSVDKIFEECNRILEYGEIAVGPDAINVATTVLQNIKDGDTIRATETTRSEALMACCDMVELIDDVLGGGSAAEPEPDFGLDEPVLNPMGLTPTMTVDDTQVTVTPVQAAEQAVADLFADEPVTGEVIPAGEPEPEPEPIEPETVAVKPSLPTVRSLILTTCLTEQR